MNGTTESLLRFVNVTTAGLLAGSLGFGEAALVPGWQEERARDEAAHRPIPIRYFNAIGPIALATSMTLAVATRGTPTRRALDLVSALGLAGVLATTSLITVPINRKLEQNRPLDYASEDADTLTRSWSRAHSVRTALGVAAFVCAAASNALRKTR